MCKRTAGIILATGYDSNTKSVDPMLRLGDTTILRRQVVTMQLAGIYPIIVLSGWDSLRVEHHLDYYGVMFFQMEDFTQIQLGKDVLPVLEYLQNKCEQVIYSPIEYPLICTNTLKKLTQAEGNMRYPVYQGKRGFPTVMDIEAVMKTDMEKLAQYHILEEFLNTQKLTVTEVPVDDEGVLCNVHNREACNRILENHTRQMEHPYVKIDIDFDTKVFDVRLSLLLAMIRETHSVKKACMRVSMSVGKAWEYINLLEEKLQYPVVDRKQGGRKGGGTRLTPAGEAYLEKYTELEMRVRNYANEEFRRLFEEEI